jgi:hypothetical protein
MFVGKKRSMESQLFTGVSLGHSHKNLTWPEKPTRGKHSSLLGAFVIYEENYGDPRTSVT